MILFCINHLGMLSQVTTLRCTKFKDKEAVLLVTSQYSCEHEVGKCLKNLEKYGLFQKVFIEKSLTLSSFSDTTGIVDVITKYFYDFFLKSNINLLDCEEILVGGEVQNWVVLYFQQNYINFSFIEFSTYQFQFFVELSDKFLNTRNTDLKSLASRLIYSVYFGEAAAFCTKKYLFKDGSACTCEDDEIIDLYKSFFQVEKKYQQIIVDSFYLDNKKIDNLLLLSSPWALNKSIECCLPGELGSERKYYIYMLISDLYYNDACDITVKGHPHTQQSIVDNTFKEFSTVLGFVPIEFMFYQSKNCFKKVVTTSFTSAEKLRSHTDDLRLINLQIIEYSYLMLKMYVIIRLLLKLQVNCDFALLQFPMDILQTYFTDVIEFKENNYSCKEIDFVQESQELGVVLVGDLDESEISSLFTQLAVAPKNAIYIFTEGSIFQKDCKFQEDFFLQYVLVKNIKKTKIKEMTLSYLDTEKLYFFCKDDRLFQGIASFTLDKSFPHVGIRIIVPPAKNAEISLTQQVLKNSSMAKSFVVEKDKYKIRPVKVLPLCYSGKKIILWGTGMWSEKFKEIFQYYNVEIYEYCDNDETKWGNFKNGKPVISPHDLLQKLLSDDEILLQIALGDMYEEQVTDQLKTMGVTDFITKDCALEIFFNK